ncbi:MAG: hypothetical protein WCC12_19960 [Anaerolineales bacterium]
MKMHLRYTSFVVIITLSLTACSLTTGEQTDLPYSSTMPAEETSTYIVTGVQPTSTRQPTLLQTPTTFQPTWTAQPTLIGSNAIEAINHMIATNGGCKLPCWWGITPGETSWENALILLSRFSPTVTSSGPFDLTRDANTRHTLMAYSVSYKIPDSRIGRGASIDVLDDVVSIVYVGSESTGEIFTIPHLLSEYGEPANIFIKTYSDTPTGILPFYIVLFYPDYQFTAIFEFEGNKAGETISVCYSLTTPRLYAWSRDESKYVNNYRLNDWVLGSNNTGLKGIEEASSLNTGTFYQRFINATSNTCFETPSSSW